MQTVMQSPTVSHRFRQVCLRLENVVFLLNDTSTLAVRMLLGVVRRASKVQASARVLVS